MSEINSVSMWEKDIEIPTYEPGKPDKNPMFLEKRVYQGSSGRVYPLPVIDKISNEKKLKKWHVVFLENKYLQIWIMPELGGRVQRALDKTNNYDFVYYNHVIKPALVGLAGPWISGGIEFNWPQHHRPSTFMPVEHALKENEDGSKTVFVSEIDIMYRTKATTGFTLYPDRAYLEITSQLYNRTDIPQTFLWWANPAVAVNDDTQSIFPPDVNAVMDHGKRDVSKFPIATGTYYKMDYSAGVDISRFKNIPVPTSYMAYRSDFNFVGGYDYAKHAGLLHVADHHVSPGKKQWTWGCGDFGKAWDRNLTDEDGPYIELMTGVYTDNQPDFTWLAPYEEKTFTQYFMPYKEIGAVKNANSEAAVNLEVNDGKISVRSYATSEIDNALIELRSAKHVYCSAKCRLSPEKTFTGNYAIENDDIESDLIISVYDGKGHRIISYTPKPKKIEKIPDPAKAIGEPGELANNESLFLAGKHIEQYRHATFDPDSYYLEGLKRDPEDIRINNAYGELLYRRGQFAESEKYFRAAVKTASRHNANPYYSEPLYNLGLSLKMQNRFDEAYDAFYKACWSADMQSCGYFELAKIDAVRKDYKLAIDHIKRALVRNSHNYEARGLGAAVYRKSGDYQKALKAAEETTSLDILDFQSYNEMYLIAKEQRDTEKADQALEMLTRYMDGQEKNYIELSLNYAAAGFHDEAADILKRFEAVCNCGPMVYYYLGYLCNKLNKSDESKQYHKKAASACPDYCFPNRLEDIPVLREAIMENPSDSYGLYYLGNLWYDRNQYDNAIAAWQKAININDTFPTAHRNLALAYFNKRNEPQKARASLEKAFKLDESDARVFLELDQLNKKLAVSPAKRLEILERHMDLVEKRDDLYLEYIILLNIKGDYVKAKEKILSRQFHPWEGGEGKVGAQYIYSNVELGKLHLRRKEYKEAVEVLTCALTYPENIGEGKLFGAQENNIYYYLGCAYEGLNDTEKARASFEKSSTGLDEPSSAMFYNDQPPEMIFYQGLAMLKLGSTAKAGSKFNKLISYGEKHLFDHVKIDYFAVSLPDFLIFDDDLDKKNTIHCHFMIGLGYLGFGKTKNAESEFKNSLKLDPNHIGLITHMRLAESISDSGS